MGAASAGIPVVVPVERSRRTHYPQLCPQVWTDGWVAHGSAVDRGGEGAIRCTFSAWALTATWSRDNLRDPLGRRPPRTCSGSTAADRTPRGSPPATDPRGLDPHRRRPRAAVPRSRPVRRGRQVAAAARRVVSERHRCARLHRRRRAPRMRTTACRLLAERAQGYPPATPSHRLPPRTRSCSPAPSGPLRPTEGRPYGTTPALPRATSMSSEGRCEAHLPAQQPSSCP